MNFFEDSGNLEALTFNYLSFGFITVINNLWTWLAVITATVGYLKIRASGCPKPDDEFQPPCNDRVSDRPDPPQEVSEPDAAVSEPACVPTIPRAVVGNGGNDVDAVTKRKFTVYYEDDVTRESDEATLTVTEEWERRDRRSDGSDNLWERWERLLRLRVGESENGWYTCQDLTVLSGNVVRLWDGGFTTSCVNVW